jgi:hypothetical protein
MASGEKRVFNVAFLKKQSGPDSYSWVKIYNGRGDFTAHYNYHTASVPYLFS